MIEPGDTVQPTLAGLTWITSATEATVEAQQARQRVVYGVNDRRTGWEENETTRYIQFEEGGHWSPASYYEKAL